MELFRKYILYGYTYAMIAEESGYSTRQLSRTFHYYLLQQPKRTGHIPNLHKQSYLLVDGLWLKKWYVMMVYRKSKDLTILHISIAGREAAPRIEDDLRHLLTLGYTFSGIVSDGGRGVVTAIKTVFPHTLHQICMAHMHRDAVNALGQHPKDYRTQRLKNLADWVWRIESKAALSYWHKLVIQWKHQHYSFFSEYRQDTTGHWWYIHKGVRKTVRILLKLPTTSFAFLEDPLLPKTTNEIEATFGHMGKRWLTHRGLKTERWEHFMKWFVYFYNQKKMAESKTKRD